MVEVAGCGNEVVSFGEIVLGVESICCEELDWVCGGDGFSRWEKASFPAHVTVGYVWDIEWLWMVLLFQQLGVGRGDELVHLVVTCYEPGRRIHLKHKDNRLEY